MKMPSHKDVKLYLGECLKGDLHDLVDASGWFTIPESKLGHHIVCAGASGQGKTESLIRIAQGAVVCYGWKVYYIDAKGSYKGAEKFLAAMYDAGLSKISFFPNATSTYDAWRGDSQALYNKLISV